MTGVEIRGQLLIVVDAPCLGTRKNAKVGLQLIISVRDMFPCWSSDPAAWWHLGIFGGRHDGGWVELVGSNSPPIGRNPALARTTAHTGSNSGAVNKHQGTPTVGFHVNACILSAGMIPMNTHMLYKAMRLIYSVTGSLCLGSRRADFCTLSSSRDLSIYTV